MRPIPENNETNDADAMVDFADWVDVRTREQLLQGHVIEAGPEGAPTLETSSRRACSSSKVPTNAGNWEPRAVLIVGCGDCIQRHDLSFAPSSSIA